jgi:hypothetical protein
MSQPDNDGIEDAVKLLKEELPNAQSIEIRAQPMPDDRLKGIILVWVNTYAEKKAIYEKYGQGDSPLEDREDLNGRADVGVCALTKRSEANCGNCEVCQKRKAYVSTLFYPALYKDWEVRVRKFPPYVRKKDRVKNEDISSPRDDHEQPQEA